MSALFHQIEIFYISFSQTLRSPLEFKIEFYEFKQCLAAQQVCTEVEHVK